MAAPPTLILSPWKIASTFAPLIASSAARNTPSHGAVVAFLSTPMSLFTLSAPKTALSASVIDVFASWSRTTPDARTAPLSLLSANRVGVAADAGAVGSAVATAGAGGVAGACAVVAGGVVAAGAAPPAKGQAAARGGVASAFMAGAGAAVEGASPARRFRREPEVWAGGGGVGVAGAAAALALAPLAQEQAAGAALVRRSPARASPARAHWRQAEQAGSG